MYTVLKSVQIFPAVIYVSYFTITYAIVNKLTYYMYPLLTVTHIGITIFDKNHATPFFKPQIKQQFTKIINTFSVGNLTVSLLTRQL